MNSTPSSYFDPCDDGLRRRNGRIIPGEENIMLEHLSHAPLISVRELASSMFDTSPEKLSSIRRRRPRNSNVISSETIRGLEDMGLPEPILDKLTSDWIDPLTQIQIQGLSAAISGRDMIGISFTSSGTTVMSVLPLVMVGLQEQLSMPISRGEGPFGLILCPSTELATHTYQLVQEFLATLKENKQPQLRPLLCVDGNDISLELEMVKRGVHIMVATPGKLNHMLANKTVNLDSCRYLALDKADLLFDTRFEHDIESILGYFKGPRQTILFCANITADVENFAKNGLVKPVTVNAGLSDLTENVAAITVDNERQSRVLEYGCSCPW